jgi:hypothetical protein
MKKKVLYPSMHPPTHCDRHPNSFVTSMSHVGNVSSTSSRPICSMMHPWLEECINHQYVDGIMVWFTNGYQLGGGIPRKGDDVGEYDGPEDSWKAMPGMVFSKIPCVGSCMVPRRRGVVIFLKTVKHIDSQYGVAFRWVGLCVHLQRWYTGGYHPRRWYKIGGHPQSCIPVWVRRCECMKWYLRRPER